MFRRSSAILVPAFAILLGLVVAFALAVTTVLNKTETEIADIHSKALQRERVLTSLYSEVYRLAIRVRDVLFATTPRPGSRSLLEIKEAVDANAQELELLLGARDPAAMQALRKALDRYTSLSCAVEEWTTLQRVAQADNYLRDQLVPARFEFLEHAASAAKLNAEMLNDRHAEVLELQRTTRSFLRAGIALALLLGLLIAILTIRRVRNLECLEEAQRLLADKHGEELRLLSQRLVRVQEEDRKALSRELHDEVGQILTALKMELGTLSTLHASEPKAFDTHLTEAKRLAAETLNTVRHMALGLRPSLLDDLGLGPALRWQAREFSNRFGVQVEVDLDGNVEEAPEGERICLFRIVQEALTNCSRHANAKSVSVILRRDEDGTILQVRDDGQGFDPDRSRDDGIGLIGIEERVKELNGTIAVRSRKGAGTTLSVRIPLAS